MNFDPPRPRRQRGENIVPMINVVFLLLIFFLMTAQIAPPEPFEVSPPQSEAKGPAEDPDTLYVSQTGVLAYEGARGDAALAALSARDPAVPLTLRADAGLSAVSLAALLPKLAAAGVRETRLVTGAP
jgi:biopolymer transport protein ExbD